MTDTTVKKFTADQKFSIGIGVVIPIAGDSVEIYFEGDYNTELMDLAELYEYSNTGIHPYTLSMLESALRDVKNVNNYETMNSQSYLTEGYIWDSEDDDDRYTRYSDLDEDYKDTILESGGYNSDTQNFVHCHEISQAWIAYLEDVIRYLETVVESDDDN
jgi:hypothetical protein